MNTYTYVRSEPYPEGHPLHGVMEKQWFRRDLEVSEYRDKLVRAQKEFEEADAQLTEANKRYEVAIKALRDAIDDK